MILYTPAHLHGVQTLPELFVWWVAISPEQTAYRRLDAVRNEWLSLSWRVVDAR